MLVIRDFYNKKQCRDLSDNIKQHRHASFQNGKLKHIGPFLMAHTTNKKKYFKNAMGSQKTFNKIFCGVDNPVLLVRDALGRMLPGYAVSPAHELCNYYSQAVIRIHDAGMSIPVHKDNISNEGQEYAISNVDHQLSCILHIQESECGGDLIVYAKRWTKTNEHFRNIGFGYSPDLVKNSHACRAPCINAGDLVIINPIYYHKVTKITGTTPRITLGMFAGLYEQDRRIVTWA